MGLNWHLEMYLGVASHPREHLIGTWNGDVARTRSIVCVVESVRWTVDLADRPKGIAAHPIPSGNTAYENVEKNADPRAMAYEEVDDKGREASDKVRRIIRITKADLVRYGYTDGCPRCTDLRGGAKDSTHNNPEDCRFRVYGEWEAHTDPKWILLVKHLESQHVPQR